MLLAGWPWQVSLLGSLVPVNDVLPHSAKRTLHAFRPFLMMCVSSSLMKCPCLYSDSHLCSSMSAVRLPCPMMDWSSSTQSCIFCTGHWFANLLCSLSKHGFESLLADELFLVLSAVEDLRKHWLSRLLVIGHCDLLLHSQHAF